MAYFLAALTGVMTVAAYPMLEWWPLIFVAYVPLLVACNGASRAQRFKLGWVAGTVTTLGMQYWISTTLVHLSGFPWWLAVSVLVLYAVLSGLGHAAFAVLYGWIRNEFGRIGWLFVVPVAWCVIERYFPALFPVYAGNTLYRAPALMQAAEYVGISGISFLVLMTNCAVALSAEDQAKGRTSDYFIPIAMSCIWLMLSVWGVVRMTQLWSTPIKTTVSVAMIQPNVTVAEKRDTTWDSRIAAWERTVDMTRSALTLKPDLVIWPEGGFPFQFIPEALAPELRTSHHPYHLFSRRLHRLAREIDADFIAGSLSRRDDQTRNSAIFFPRNGGQPEIYDKQHLLPFGEEIPFAERFPMLRDAVPGLTHHQAGQRDLTWKIADLRAAIGICYEAIFPEITRRQINHEDADLLVNLTNDVWFGDTAAPYLHLMVQQARAIELRSWLIRSTNSGISAFIDPTGRIRATGAVGAQDTTMMDIAVHAVAPSLYRRFGDIWLDTLGGLCLLWLVWRAIQNRKNLSQRGNQSTNSVSNGVAGVKPDDVKSP